MVENQVTRIVKYEVTIRLEGDGDVLGLPDTVRESIHNAIQHSEGEGTLSGGAEDASAFLVGVKLSPSEIRADECKGWPGKRIWSDLCQ